MNSFTDALGQWKRRARLTGRPVTQNEVAGIAEGFADSASERLNRAATIANQEKQLELNAQEQAWRQQDALEQRRLAKEALDAEKQSDYQGLAIGFGVPLLRGVGNIMSQSSIPIISKVGGLVTSALGLW